MFNSVLSIPSFFYSNSQDESRNQTKEFHTLLTSSKYQKTAQYIQDHPELVNAPLPGTSMSAFELSLSQRKTENMRYLIALGANINKAHSGATSGLDNLLLIKDKSLLKNVFGNVLATLLYDAKVQIDSSSISPLILHYADLQIKMIQEDIKKHSDLTEINNQLADFIPLIQSEHTKALDQKIQKATKLQVFNLTLYSLFTHNTYLLKRLYESIGPELLNLKTLDLKNLYQLAAIADNPEAIELFYEWGLDPNPQFSSKSKNNFSAFHYAIFCPSFTTFLTLLKVGLLMPPPAPLQGLTYKVKQLNKTLDQLTFSPIQLLVHRATINDPLSKGSYLETIYLLLEAIALYYEMTLQMDSGVKAALAAVRTSYFFGQSINTLLNNKILKLHSLVTTLTLALLLSLAETGQLQKVLPSKNILPYLKYFTTLMAVRKIWKDFTSYYHSYSYRPWKTLWNFSKSIFSNFLYFKHTYFEEIQSFERIEKEAVNYQNRKENSFDFERLFKSMNNYSSQPSETKNFVPFDKIKNHVRQLSYSEIYTCSQKKFLDSITKCLMGEYKEHFADISKTDINKLITKSSSVIHPDKLVTIHNVIISLCSKSKCDDLWTGHLSQVFRYREFYNLCNQKECGKIASSFDEKMKDAFTSLNDIRP